MKAAGAVARAWLWLVHRVRRRGAALLFFAFLDFVYGLQMVTADHELKGIALYKWAGTIAPLQVWGTGWLMVGGICLVCAFRARDRVGFAAAAIVKSAWGVMSVFGWLVGDVPRGQVSAVLWIVFAGFVLVVSTWPEANDLPALAETTDGVSSAGGEG